MHNGPVPGKYTSEYKLVKDLSCPQCRGPVEMRVWESDDTAYEDERYRCTKCAYVWWVEGPDA
jgi:hypothetical protein